MAVSAGMIAKAAATVLSNEKLRKGVGWTLVAILSPIIVLIALLCSIGSGGADHNNQAVAASFYGVSYSTEVPAEFRHHIEEMRTAFSLLDSAVASVNGQTESGNGLDPIRIKAVFYALCFGEAAPSQRAASGSAYSTKGDHSAHTPVGPSISRASRTSMPRKRSRSGRATTCTCTKRSRRSTAPG